MSSWRLLLDVNLSGAFYVLRASVPHLRAAGGGSIVHVGSLNATVDGLVDIILRDDGADDGVHLRGQVS